MSAKSDTAILFILLNRA